jgi:hypothetical protein
LRLEGNGNPAERTVVDDWMVQLTQALDEPPVSGRELGSVLRLARDVAHGVERRLAPVAAFAVGAYVGRRTAQGASRDEALREGLAAAATVLPGQAQEQDHI